MSYSDKSVPQPTGIRALVVDDSATVRELMDLTLGHLQVDVEFTATGEDALALLGRKSYDIVFLDLILPGINGYSVCKSIKNDKATKDIPVIMLTGKNTTFDKVRGIMAGTDVYLTKPLEPSALLAAMNKCLPRWREELPAAGPA